MRKDVANQITPYFEARRGEAPELIIDANNDFTGFGFSLMQKYKLSLPSDAFLEYLTNPDSVKKKIMMKLVK